MSDRSCYDDGYSDGEAQERQRVRDALERAVKLWRPSKGDKNVAFKIAVTASLRTILEDIVANKTLIIPEDVAKRALNTSYQNGETK